VLADFEQQFIPALAIASAVGNHYKTEKMHQFYEKHFNHPCDFRVKYRFYTELEGGRKQLPQQGIRFNFWYENDNHEMNGYFMIWPEFEDLNGEVIEEGMVLQEGFARMWIINDDLRLYHAERINVGTKGNFIEVRKISECEVVELLHLKTELIAKNK
jgi:hypothetical protein